MKGLIVDESMTSFTSTSGEVSASSATRFETATATQYSFASTNQPKKKRSLPGNPGQLIFQIIKLNQMIYILYYIYELLIGNFFGWI